MVQYDWEILSLYAVPSLDGLNDVVTRITWRYQAKDGSYAGDIYKDTYLSSSNSSNFINYNNLTKETIVGWIEDVEDMDEINKIVLAKLDVTKNPSIVEKRLPWDTIHLYNQLDKYVLVHEDTVVYGPVHWHSDLMNDHLEKLGLDRSLPIDIMARKQGIVPISQPTVINEDTKIYKANVLNEQPKESLFHDNGHIIWNFSTGVAIGTYVAIDKPIEEVKETLINIVESNRYTKETKGTNVTVGSETFLIPTGQRQRTLLVEKLFVMQDNDVCMWRFMNQKWCLVSKSDILSMLIQLDSFIQNLVDWEHNLSEEINAAESVNDLKNIKID